jgi:hypothetical protein
MEAGAVFHQDPKHATSRPKGRAVPEARPVGSGWVAFAGAYMMITGLFNLVWGITALSKKEYFVEGGLVFSNLQFWGWIALIVAVIQFGVGALLFARKMIGMLAALVVSMTAIFVNFLSIGAYPVWSSIAIVGSCLVLWAVTVHSDEFA